MKKTCIAALAALTLMLPAAAPAQDIVVSYDNLVSALSGYHGIPGADYWGRLDPDLTRAALIRMAGDPKVFTPMRARALRALTYFANDEVSDFLYAKAKNDSVAYMRSSAYEALAIANGAEAASILEEGLNDRDVIVRLIAARTLGVIKTPVAVKALERRLATEKNATARSVISKTLERIRR